jgi:hypothetical protein
MDKHLAVAIPPRIHKGLMISDLDAQILGSIIKPDKEHTIFATSVVILTALGQSLKYE